MDEDSTYRKLRRGVRKYPNSSDNLEFPAVKPGITTTLSNGVYYVVDTAGNIIGSVGSLIFSLGEKIVNTGIEVGKAGINTGKIIAHTTVDLGKHVVTGIKDTIGEVGMGTARVGKKIIHTGIDGVENIGRELSNVGRAVYKTGENVVKDTARGTKRVAQTIANTPETIGKPLLDGVGSVVEEAGNAASKTVGAVSNTFDNATNTMVKGVRGVTNQVRETGNNTHAIVFKGGMQNSSTIKGVSIENIAGGNDYDTRMLIPSTFVNSNHVYFVRYHPEGTHVYNYKFDMNGGKVDNLTLRNVTPIWQSNNFNDSISNSTLLNSQEILTNLINDLNDY